jgi:uncharacterized protein (DUF305 family)
MTRPNLRLKRAVVAAALIGSIAVVVAASPAVTTDSPFMTKSSAATAKMTTAMQVQPSGDADVDFVAMMVPHHQGAIDMARAELLYGRNETLRRMAQEILVTQQQEISAMRLALGEHTTIHQES